MNNQIKQAYVSKGLKFFKEKFLNKFNLSDYYSKDEPLAMFSVCRDEDYEIFLRHRGPVNVIWCGSDAMMIDESRSKILKSKEVRHISTSKFISEDLRSHNITYEYIPVSAANNDISMHIYPRGKNIYFYHDNNYEKDFYGQSYINEIKRRTNLNIIESTKNKYTSKELISVYGSCFISLRLTNHDGIPTTVTEMGLMGRRSVHNGYVPHCYAYEGIDDICESIITEYENRHFDDLKIISEDWKNYINRTDWLKFKE
jgi:hypothetical protein